MKYLVEVHLDKSTISSIPFGNPQLFLEENTSFEAVWNKLVEENFGTKLFAVKQVIVWPLGDSFEYSMHPKFTLRKSSDDPDAPEWGPDHPNYDEMGQ